MYYYNKGMNIKMESLFNNFVFIVSTFVDMYISGFIVLSERIKSYSKPKYVCKPTKPKM